MVNPLNRQPFNSDEDLKQLIKQIRDDVTSFLATCESAGYAAQDLHGKTFYHPSSRTTFTMRWRPRKKEFTLVFKLGIWELSAATKAFVALAPGGAHE